MERFAIGAEGRGELGQEDQETMLCGWREQNAEGLELSHHWCWFEGAGRGAEHRGRGRRWTSCA